MQKMVMLSRHVPTQTQVDLAEKQGYLLTHGGDVNAFSPTLPEDVMSSVGDAQAVACVHPNVALASRALGFSVGVFENANRAQPGEKPSFSAVSLQVWGASIS